MGIEVKKHCTVTISDFHVELLRCICEVASKAMSNSVNIGTEYKDKLNAMRAFTQKVLDES